MSIFITKTRKVRNIILVVVVEMNVVEAVGPHRVVTTQPVWPTYAVVL